MSICLITICFSRKELLRKKQRAIQDNNLQQLALTSHNLGNWYQENQEYENALENYKDEAKAYKHLDKRLETSKAYRMIGEMYMLLEDFENALNYELKYLSKSAIEISFYAFKNFLIYEFFFLFFA